MTIILIVATTYFWLVVVKFKSWTLQAPPPPQALPVLALAPAVRREMVTHQTQTEVTFKRRYAVPRFAQAAVNDAGCWRI